MADDDGMTVKELIETLQEYNDDAKVSLWLDPCTQVEILSVYSGDLKAGGAGRYVKENPESDPDVYIDLEAK